MQTIDEDNQTTDGINTALEGFRTAVNDALTGLPSGVDIAMNVGVIKNDAMFNNIEDAIADTRERDFKSTSDIVADIKTYLTGVIMPVQVEFALEIFTFGADENHAIYRALLGRDRRRHSAVFEGTVEYTMLNQLNVDDIQHAHRHNNLGRRTGHHTQ